MQFSIHEGVPAVMTREVDGAALAVVGSGAAGEAMGMTPRAKVVATATTGADPVVMLTGPVPASRKALDAAGLSVSDIDLFEVNEAFAGVPLMFQQEFGIPDDRLNVNGGSMAIGHPLGASGGRILGHAAHELARRGGGVAVVAICIGVGQGLAVVLER